MSFEEPSPAPQSLSGYPSSSRMAKMLFYPTLGYNCLRNWWRPNRWPYYNRVDDTVILGALPFKSMMDELINDEKVSGVVSINEPHELEHNWVASPSAWSERGIKHLQIKVGDFFYAPDVDDVYSAVQFIRQFEGTGKSVYVHCKAGRCRSATVVACYLMERNGWFANVAKRQLRIARPQVIFPAPHWEVLCDYSRALQRKDTTQGNDEKIDKY